MAEERKQGKLQVFRAYMSSMNLTEPSEAINAGFYVEPPMQSLAKDIAQRVELEPTANHVVVGGIGSGKTTVLLRAARLIKESISGLGDEIKFIDVSKHHNLDKPLKGVVFALAGKYICDRLKGKPLKKAKDAADAMKAILAYADGFVETYRMYDEEEPPYQEEPDYDPSEEEPRVHTVHNPGVVVPPIGPVSWAIKTLIPQLRLLKEELVGQTSHLVLEFDSLDRIDSPNRFADVVRHDIRALKEAGIGVIVAAPLRFSLGDNRAVIDLFDKVHFQRSFNPNNSENAEFLKSVLRLRANVDFLPDEAIKLLVHASGGVLRDLIAIAKGAGESAYVAGHDRIHTDDAKLAVDNFGRILAIGLDDQQVKMLTDLDAGKDFVFRTETEMSLIETRRVLLYEENKWVVHPALSPHLKQMALASETKR